MTRLMPFADDNGSTSIDSLVIENGRDKVALYGTLDITRDKAGLALARDLVVFMTRVVGVLSADPNLPDKLPPPEQPATVRNPFS